MLCAYLHNSSLFAQGRSPFFVQLLQVFAGVAFEFVVRILAGAQKRIEFFHERFVILRARR
jgi:hypothetical protein